jgi:hypothetical protein
MWPIDAQGRDALEEVKEAALKRAGNGHIVGSEAEIFHLGLLHDQHLDRRAGQLLHPGPSVAR